MSTSAETRRFAPVTTSPAAVRSFVSSAISDIEADVADTALLLASETATNAVLFTERPFDVVVDRSHDRVRVEVHDLSTDPVRPNVEPPGADQPTGRGLYLVDRYSSRWGVDPTDEGKVVWFEVDFRRPADV